jgi:hypothetical protein
VILHYLSEIRKQSFNAMGMLISENYTKH